MYFLFAFFDHSQKNYSNLLFDRRSLG
ncbi:hypothetical protein CY0110_18682 [Crocosphaera chwakensis CCY0110]|uniref:Uncharacterized protein n=1 Tax=Crocosphaera chwakensis CCY0110 TaxID=391612 RepID=A3IJ68_9CHRO|nr:hypothetical protein CY0110_18682 [Crocosphaera chwakensis CCY0110]